MIYALLSYHTTKGLENISGWRRWLGDTLRANAVEVALGTYVFDLDARESEYHAACAILESHDCPFCVVQFSNPGKCLVVTNKASPKLSKMGLKNKHFPLLRPILPDHNQPASADHFAGLDGNGNGGRSNENSRLRR